jgi:hypothetical protein
MLPIIEDPNTQKQLRRSEQIKKWNEREMMSNTTNSNSNSNSNNNNNNYAMDDEEINAKLTTISNDTNDKYAEIYNRTTKV